MLKNYVFLLVVGSSLSCESPIKPVQEEIQIPKQTVADFDNKSEVALKGLNDYISFVNKRHSKCRNCSVVEMIEQHDTFTSNFKKLHTQLIEKSFEDAPDYGLGFDPLLDGQDFPDEGFTVKLIDGDYITLKGIDWPEYEVTVKMKLEGGNWLIDGAGIINIPEDKRAKR